MGTLLAIATRDPRTNSHQPNSDSNTNPTNMLMTGPCGLDRLPYSRCVGCHLLTLVVDQRPNLPGIDRIEHDVLPFSATPVAVDRRRTPVDSALMEHVLRVCVKTDRGSG
jgi:hypothetical protein